MINQSNKKILNTIFGDDLFTEEQKAVMIHMLSYLWENDMPLNSKGFFLDLFNHAGFGGLGESIFFKYAEKVYQTNGHYANNILNKFTTAQSESYAMLICFFLINCKYYSEDTEYMHKSVDEILSVIGINNEKKIFLYQETLKNMIEGAENS